MHVSYHLTGIRGVAQTWGHETLPSIGMQRGSNSAPVFTSPLRARNTLIFVVYW